MPKKDGSGKRERICNSGQNNGGHHVLLISIAWTIGLMYVSNESAHCCLPK